MKSVALAFVVFFFALPIIAQTYQPVADKSTVKFVIKNFGINTGGSFNAPQGTIIFDPSDLSKSVFDVSIDVSTIDTDNDSRDKSLRSDEYFSVKDYPKITLKSDKIESAGKAGSYILKGKLTIKATTKDVSIPFTATSKADEWVFDGGFKMDRRDYKVGKSSAVLSDGLTVSLSVTAAKK